MLLHAHGEAVLRVKGLLNVGLGQSCCMACSISCILRSISPRWPGEDQRSHLVFILHALEPETIRMSLQAFQHLLGAHPTVDSD